MNPDNIRNTIQAVIDGFTPLAQKLQVPLEKLFSWAVVQNYVIAIVLILVLLILFPILWWGVFKLKKFCIKLKDERGDPDENPMMGFYTALSFLIVGTAIGTPLIVYNILSRLLNPEYMALLDIIGRVTSQ